MNSKKSKGQYISFLKSYACKRRLLFFYAVIVVIIIISTGISLIRPRLQGKIIDELSNPASIEYSYFMVSLVVFLGMLLISYILSYGQKYIITVISEEIGADIRQKIHDKLARVKVEFFEHVELSNILLKADKDVSAIKQCGITSIITLVSNVAILIVVPPYMISIHKGIAFTNILLLITVPFISRLLGKLIQQTSEEVLYGYNDTTNILTNTYNNWFNIRIFRCYEYVHDKFKDKNQLYKKMTNKQNFLYILNVMSILIVQFIGMAVIWIVGAREVFKGNMTIGTIMALMNYQTIIMNPIIGIADFANEYHTAIVSLKDINDLMEYPDTEIKGKTDVSHIDEIKLEHVSFAYPGAEFNVLTDLNYSFHKGKVYAIHAKSGKGKSTLFNLITGIYKPVKGDLFVNQFLITGCNLSSYWSKIGFVMQRSRFFKDTVEKNMGLLRNITIEELDELAVYLDLYDEMYSLPEVWKTEIKTDPYNFSEGQIRRLDILRNILKNPELLIFDEATANIDQKRRKKFYKLLHLLSKDKIIIFSTHNQEELTEADEVIDLAKL